MMVERSGLTAIKRRIRSVLESKPAPSVPLPPSTIAPQAPSVPQAPPPQPITSWRESASAAPGLPDFTLFKAVQVLPKAEAALAPQADKDLICPDFDGQIVVRQLAASEPINHPSARQDIPFAATDGPAIWCGYAVPHFGHLVGETLTRVLWSVRQRPEDRMLFTLWPGTEPGDVKEFFWNVLNWYGIARDQVQFVTGPLSVSELRVLPVAEDLYGPAPTERYLDLLDENTLRNRVPPINSEVLYVTRHPLLKNGNGCHAGEGYLVTLLKQLGVTVIDPAAIRLRQQLRHYLGAKCIVFAEGSAVHGRQLLGRVDQKIVILNRRPGNPSIAQSALRPRVSRLEYVEATRRMVVPVIKTGSYLPNALAFYDVPKLLEGFATIGVDLGRIWDDAAYQEARSADFIIWARGLMSQPLQLDLEQTFANLSGACRDEGL